MLPLTIHLIIENNEKTIENTLASIEPLEANVIAADIGSRDRTPYICKDHGVNVVPRSHDDRSKIRNSMIDLSDTSWQLWIEPWEILAAGQQNIINILLQDGFAYHVTVIQDDVLTRQIRLWTKKSGLRFVNPIYESLAANHAPFIDTTIYAQAVGVERKLELIEAWKTQQPGYSDPYYFLACAFLEQRKYKEFMNVADEYLFREVKAVRPITMIRYYKGMVYCYIHKNAEDAIRHILACIEANPLMSEFWCLLGDVYYFILKKYDKAKALYTNAILLGSRRMKNDLWPMQISKYKEYPQKMYDSCSEMIKHAHLLNVQ